MNDSTNPELPLYRSSKRRDDFLRVTFDAHGEVTGGAVHRSHVYRRMQFAVGLSLFGLSVLGWSVWRRHKNRVEE